MSKKPVGRYSEVRDKKQNAGVLSAIPGMDDLMTFAANSQQFLVRCARDKPS